MQSRKPAFVVVLAIGVLLLWVYLLNSLSGGEMLAYPAPSHASTRDALVIESYPAPQTTDLNTLSAYPGPGPVEPAPTPDTFRQGVAAAAGSNSVTDRHTLGSWGYYWGPGISSYPSNVDHVPMLAWAPSTGLPTVSTIQHTDAQTPHDYWLVFNECEHQAQCNTSASEAAQFYHNDLLPLISAGDPNAELIVGGVNAHPCGIQWLEDFVQYYELHYGEFNPAGWHFHIYPEIFPDGWTPENEDCTGTWGAFTQSGYDRLSFSSWRSDALNALQFVCQYGKPEDEVWFTELGCLYPVDKCQDDERAVEYMADITTWLNGAGRWVTRYAWYTDWEQSGGLDHTWLYNSSSVASGLSPIGQYYSNVEPIAATGLLCESLHLPAVFDE